MAHKPLSEDEQRLFDDWAQQTLPTPWRCLRGHEIPSPGAVAEYADVDGRSLIIVTCPSCRNVEWFDPKYASG